MSYYYNALEHIMAGGFAEREAWHKHWDFIGVEPANHATASLAYIFIQYPEREKMSPDHGTPELASARVPWTPSQTDQLADDWILR